jgi:tetratricopeptide (TPR) repeat protein
MRVCLRLLCAFTLVLASGCARKPSESGLFLTEEHWLVNEVTRDIASMLTVDLSREATNSFALRVVPIRLVSKDGATGYRIEALRGKDQPLSSEIHVEPFVWSPDCYAPFIRKVISAWQLKVTPSSTRELESTVMVRQLRNLTAETIQTANVDISQQLATNMLNPDLHEQAAFLLGGFALREAAGSFSDTRQTLCRLSAHLSMARALRENNPSPEGRIADIMLLTLVGRQRDALDAIARLRQTKEKIIGLESWLTALTLRNTEDWRILHAPPKASFVEQLEYYRALCSRLGTSAAVTFLDESSPEMVPDWGRILMERPFSVEEGHRFVEPTLGLELHELEYVHQQVLGKPLGEAPLAPVLNSVPQPCVHRNGNGAIEVQVIDWGMWAQFFQRHICHATIRGVWFMRDRWGVKDYAKQFQDRSAQYFGQLDLFPICIKRWNADARPPNVPEYESAINSCLSLLKRAPQLVNCASWTCLRYRVSGSNAAEKIPKPDEWFRPSMPSGTAYDAGTRFDAFRNLYQLPLPDLEALHTLAPCNCAILSVYCKRKYTHPMTVADFKTEYAEQCEYDLGLLTSLANLVYDKPQEYQRAYQKICDLNPNEFTNLGYYLKEHGLDSEAAAAYQKAVELASDRVRVANNCQWLVNYYYDHGSRDQALNIAEMAAGVYSYRGLETAARLMERAGRLDRAETYFQNISERYEDSMPLFGFYFRQDTAQPGGAYSRKLKDAERKDFPNGLERVALQNFQSPPVDGAAFSSASHTLEKWGLKAGDVVVALDGYRVRTEQQYLGVRSISNDPKMVLIVWRDGQYRQVDVTLDGRRFGVDLKTYHR